jgi:FAD/FMN-containing dehydrogenase
MSDNILRELAEIVGEDNVLVEGEQMESLLVERRGLYQGSCLAVILPASTKETAAVVELCSRESIAFTPQSGNTGLCGGAIPTDGILINLGRMNSIRNVDPLNATITAEAGCILADLQDAASKEGLLFTLSSPSEKECQIGGNVSTNLGGINVLRYGNTRDLVLGLEVILPSGKIWHGLQGLRKDNSSYSFKDLFIGAEGTLGIVTAVTLKLFPYPKIKQTALVATQNLNELMDAFAVVRNNFADNLCGFEIISRVAMEVVCEGGKDVEDPLDTPYPWYGLFELNSTDGTLDLRTSLKNVCENASFTYILAEDEEEASRLWNLREQISDAQKVKGASIKHDVSLPLNRLAEFITEATQLVEKRVPGVLPCCFGHAGDGNVHFNLTQPAEMDSKEFLSLWAEINKIVHDLVHSMGGSIAAEHGVGQLKRDELLRYKDDVELEMMRTLKKAFDPDNICNPGKLVNMDSCQKNSLKKSGNE